MQINVATAPAPRAQSRLAALACLALVFVTIASARVIYVSLYANPLPYWDQWDELNSQIGPLFNGTWHFMQLFAPHSEHRIVFTHLVSFLLAWMNHQRFDNLVESYFNVLIYALLWTVLFALLTNSSDTKKTRWVLAVVIAALGVLPFDWENILTGFQNQFYFLGLAAIAAIGVASYCNISGKTLALLFVLALASLFTMASGLLAAAAVCFAIMLRIWREPIRIAHVATTFLLMPLLMILGLVLLKDAPGYAGNSSFHAHSAVEFCSALLVAMMWPFWTQHVLLGVLAALLVWSPTLIWGYAFIRTRRVDANEIFAVTLAAWVFLQCVAMAYDRGNAMGTMTSRYTEITAIGIAANTWLALKLSRRHRNADWSRVVIGFALVLVAGTFIMRSFPEDVKQLKSRHYYTTVETYNVQRYFAGTPLPILPAFSQELPYPWIQQLREMLDSPEVRAVLPPAAFPQPDMHRARLSAGAASLQRTVRQWLPKGLWVVDVPHVLSGYSDTQPGGSELQQAAADFDLAASRPVGEWTTGNVPSEGVRFEGQPALENPASLYWPEHDVRAHVVRIDLDAKGSGQLQIQLYAKGKPDVLGESYGTGRNALFFDLPQHVDGSRVTIVKGPGSAAVVLRNIIVRAKE